MDEDLRGHKRIEWNRPGKIISLLGHHICNCWVKDISPSGARLIVPMSEVVPDFFRLNYGAEDVKPKCSVRWRTDKELGVRFIGDE
jgi:PilZ domain